MNRSTIDTIPRLISWRSRKVDLKRQCERKKEEYCLLLVNGIEETLGWISSCEDEAEKMKMEDHLEDLRNRLTEFKKGIVI